MPKQCGFEQVGRHGAGIHRNKWFIAARRIQVNRLRDHFFASAALALQQHGRPAVRHLRDQVENLEHGLAFAHNIFEVVALLERALKLNVFFFRAPPAHGGAHIGKKFFVVPRLLHKIRRARLHGAHRIFHRAVRGNHNDGQARIVRANFGKNVHPIAAGQRQIEQHQVKRMVRHLREAVFSRYGCIHRKSFDFEQSLQ